MFIWGNSWLAGSTILIRNFYSYHSPPYIWRLWFVLNAYFKILIPALNFVFSILVVFPHNMRQVSVKAHCLLHPKATLPLFCSFSAKCCLTIMLGLSPHVFLQNVLDCNMPFFSLIFHLMLELFFSKPLINKPLPNLFCSWGWLLEKLFTAAPGGRPKWGVCLNPCSPNDSNWN